MGKDIAIHGKEVAGASRQNEKMPDGVMKKKPLPEEKNQAHRVTQASCQNKIQTACGNQLDGGLNGQDQQPSHRDITERRQ